MSSDAQPSSTPRRTRNAPSSSDASSNTPSMNAISDSWSDLPTDQQKERTRSANTRGSSRHYGNSSASMSEFGIDEDWEMRYSALNELDIDDDDVEDDEDEDEGEDEEEGHHACVHHDLVIEELSDAEREWNENLEQLQQIFTFMLIPFLGKYIGRKCAYWGWNKFMQWKYPVELHYRPTDSRATGFVEAASPL